MNGWKQKWRDEECFGWLHADGTFEQEPMPGDWRYDFRGAQILESRMSRGYCEAPVYLPGGRPRTLEEIFAPERNAAAKYEIPWQIWIVVGMAVIVAVLAVLSKPANSGPNDRRKAVDAILCCGR